MKTLDSESEGPAGSLERLGAEIVAEIKKGTNHLTAAGQKLLEAKRRSDAGEFGEPNFPNFLRLHCRNMSQSWAYQLMAVARGEMTVEELRSKAAERQRQCRERKKTASAPTAETKAELAKNKTEPAKPDLAKAEPTKLEPIKATGKAEPENVEAKSTGIDAADGTGDLATTPVPSPTIAPSLDADAETEVDAGMPASPVRDPDERAFQALVAAWDGASSAVRERFMASRGLIAATTAIAA